MGTDQEDRNIESQIPNSLLGMANSDWQFAVFNLSFRRFPPMTPAGDLRDGFSEAWQRKTTTAVLSSRSEA
jgi:hypothetical protein